MTGRHSLMVATAIAVGAGVPKAEIAAIVATAPGGAGIKARRAAADRLYAKIDRLHGARVLNPIGNDDEEEDDDDRDDDDRDDEAEESSPPSSRPASRETKKSKAKAKHKSKKHKVKPAAIAALSANVAGIGRALRRGSEHEAARAFRQEEPRAARLADFHGHAVTVAAAQRQLARARGAAASAGGSPLYNDCDLLTRQILELQRTRRPPPAPGSGLVFFKGTGT